MTVKKVDCLSELCPIPLLRAIQELKTMKPGDILILLCNHSCVVIDIKKWALEKNYPIHLIELDGGDWEVHIEKSEEN